MNRGVRGVDELSGNKRALDLCGKLIRFGDRALHTLGAIGQHQFGAVCLHQLSALDRHGLGHDDDDAVASCGGDCGKSDTGIAGGRLDNDAAFFEQSFFLGVVDHRLGDTILDRSGGIEVLELCEDGRLKVQLLFDVGQLQQRSLADELICGCVNVSHDVSPYYIVWNGICKYFFAPFLSDYAE